MTKIAEQENRVQLQLSENWSLRIGAGLGINQGHLTGTWHLRPDRLAFLLQRCRVICELADEPFPPVTAGTSINFTEFCRLLGKVIGALQRYAKIPTDRNIHVSSVRSSGDILKATVAIPAFAPRATMTVMKWLWETLNSPDASIDRLEEKFYGLQETLRGYGISGENQWRIIQAALDEGLPVSYLVAEFAVLGSGRVGRLFHSFATDQTSYIGVALAQDKYLTSRILRSAGLPGAVNLRVHSAGQAEMEAMKMGFPVVIKPGNLDRGQGVESDLISVSAVRSAFDSARTLTTDVLLEKYQPGFTHRLTVIDGQVVRVTRHVAYGVYGDGIHSVEQLVGQLAAELSQRKRTHRTSKAEAVIDAEAESLLSQRSLDRSYVPGTGEYVRLRRKDNISLGGVRTTLNLQDVHPDNLHLAVCASRRLNLDIAGIDLITENIGISWLDSDVTICEVNAKPQVVARDNPEMYKIILRTMFGSETRIPAVLHVVSENCRASFLQDCIQANPAVLVSDISGIWLGNRKITHSFDHGFAAAKSIIADTSAARMISILSPREVHEFGSPLEKWDEIHLHLSAVSSPAQNLDHARARLGTILEPHSITRLKFIETP